MRKFQFESCSSWAVVLSQAKDPELTQRPFRVLKLVRKSMFRSADFNYVNRFKTKFVKITVLPPCQPNTFLKLFTKLQWNIFEKFHVCKWNVYEGYLINLAILILGHCESRFCHRYCEVLHPRKKWNRFWKEYLQRYWKKIATVGTGVGETYQFFVTFYSV